MLQRSEDIDGKYEVERPLKPLNRVKAQKSIFTQPQNGFIDPNDFNTITVPCRSKTVDTHLSAEFRKIYLYKASTTIYMASLEIKKCDTQSKHIFHLLRQK